MVYLNQDINHTNQQTNEINITYFHCCIDADIDFLFCSSDPCMKYECVDSGPIWAMFTECEVIHARKSGGIQYQKLELVAFRSYLGVCAQRARYVCI